jgi:very-short-patch-repair endonuclease
VDKQIKMTNSIFHNPKQKEFRRKLRQADIACEKIMWYKLRNSQQGYKFRRQVSIGNYIVDFYCPQLKLVVEIDGATHATSDEIRYDLERDDYLKSLGLTVKRYLNVDVKNNLSDLMHDLQMTCEKIDKIRSFDYSTSP